MKFVKVFSTLEPPRAVDGRQHTCANTAGAIFAAKKGDSANVAVRETSPTARYRGLWAGSSGRWTDVETNARVEVTIEPREI